MKKDFNHTIYLFFVFFSLILSEMLEAGIELASVFPVQPLEKLAVDKGYELELLDPHHRHMNFLKPVYEVWNLSWQATHENFWDFIENEKTTLLIDFPALYDPSNYMVWLDSEDKRANYAATFSIDESGRTLISNAGGEIIADGKWMFVLMDGSFYVAQEKKFQFHHTSLSGGEAVDAAGTFTIKKGCLSNISLVSGHYKPKIEHGRRCLQALADLQVDVFDVLITYCVMKGTTPVKKKVLVEDFLKGDFDLSDDGGESFFYPLNLMETLSGDKIELFLTYDDVFWVGNNKLSEKDPLCEAEGPFLMSVSASLKDGKIAKIIFNMPFEVPSEVEKMRIFLKELLNQGFDVDKMSFRIVENHEKSIVGFSEVMEKITEHSISSSGQK